MKRARVLAVLLTCAFAAAPARAETPPSVWQRAKDPTSEAAYRLHLRIWQKLEVQPSRFELLDGEQRSALGLVLNAPEALRSDILIRFDLGTIYTRLKQYDDAARVLKSALADAPDHPSAEEAWSALSDACGHIGDHVCERTAYREILRRRTEDRFRAIPTLNLAETEMHLGNLKEAIDGYREALRIAGTMPASDTAPMAVWGLAIAEDRSGDHVAAMKDARFALGLERSMGLRNLLHSDHVFFVPDYEVLWYDALAAEARAREATSAHEAARLWSSCEHALSGYVRAAERAREPDRFLGIAKARLAQVRVELERADKKRAKEPPPEGEPDEVPL